MKPNSNKWHHSLNHVYVSWGTLYKHVMNLPLNFYIALETESCHNTNFVVTGDTTSCHKENLRYQQLKQSWHRESLGFQCWQLYAVTSLRYIDCILNWFQNVSRRIASNAIRTEDASNARRVTSLLIITSNVTVSLYEALFCRHVSVITS